VLLLLPAYFILAVALIAMVVFPDMRRGVLGGARTLQARVARLFGRWTQRAGGVAHGVGGTARRGIGGVRGFVQTYSWQITIVLTIVLLPSLFAFFLRHKHTFDYVESGMGPDPRINALLVGERLVPPAPPPPEAFTTREVERVRPNLGGASRDWNLLDADFRQRLLVVFQVMRERHGYEMVLLEGYRSPERQNELAARGSHVTNARAFQSYHQHGLAADVAFYRDGKIVITEKDPWAMRGYELYGETAEMMGLTWGGRWKMMDFGHVELRRPGVMRRNSGSGGAE